MRVKHNLTYLVVITGIDISGHAKIWDFDHQLSTNKAVSGRQVTMDKMVSGEVDHTIGYLGGYVHQICL